MNPKQWLAGLSYRNRILAVSLAAIFISVCVGPCRQFFSNRNALERAAAENGKGVAMMLAAGNSSALSEGKEELCDAGAALAVWGVKDAFITDAAGLVVAPTERFHEDARKDRVVREALAGDGAAIRKKLFGSYEIAAPIFGNSKKVGVAKISYAAENGSFWWGILKLLEAVFFSAVAFAAGVYGIMRVPKKEEVRQQVSEVREYGNAAILNHIGSPVYILNKSFCVSFANDAAKKERPDIVGKHIADIGRNCLEMAEELEMLQTDEVKKDRSVLWRMTDGDYGLSI